MCKSENCCPKPELQDPQCFEKQIKHEKRIKHHSWTSVNFRATEENSKLRNRYEQAKEDCETAVSLFSNVRHEFRRFQEFLVLILICKLYHG